MIRGFVYFVLVFCVGFILGTIRVLWLVPHVGQRTAELLEAPLMFVAIYLSARFITQRFEASRAVEYLYSGAVALTFLLIVEFSVILGLQDLGIREYLAQRDPVAGGVYVVMLIIFTVMPWLVGRRLAAAISRPAAHPRR